MGFLCAEVLHRRRPPQTLRCLARLTCVSRVKQHFLGYRNVINGRYVWRAVNELSSSIIICYCLLRFGWATPGQSYRRVDQN